jgi:hypothetical protein
MCAGGAGLDVLKSTDGGNVWTPSGEGLTDPEVYSLAIDPYPPGTVYAGTSSGVFALHQP